MMRHGEAVSVDEPVPVNPPPVEPPAPSPTETTKPAFDIPQPHVSAPNIDVGHLVLIGLVIVGLAVAAYVAVSLVQRWWFHGNEAIILARKQRKKIADDFGLTIGVPRRDGSFSIAPKETQTWQRDGLSGELISSLRPKSGNILVDFPAIGRVRLRTAFEPPAEVYGKCFSESESLVIGVNAVDSLPIRINQSETCGYLIVCVPGYGKTKTLDALKKAWKKGSRPAKIVNWNGKKDSQSLGIKYLEALKKDMDDRLSRDVDAWSGDDCSKLPLKILIVDEADRLFKKQNMVVPGMSKKEAKEAEDSAKNQAERAKGLVEDIISRGRQAGCLLVIATQRASANDIPTAIRDKMSVRLCGRVNSDDSVVMALGRRADAGEPDPKRIDAVGRFVVDDGRSEWREMQVYA